MLQIINTLWTNSSTISKNILNPQWGADLILVKLIENVTMLVEPNCKCQRCQQWRTQESLNLEGKKKRLCWGWGAKGGCCLLKVYLSQFERLREGVGRRGNREWAGGREGEREGGREYARTRVSGVDLKLILSSQFSCLSLPGVRIPSTPQNSGSKMYP